MISNDFFTYSEFDNQSMMILFVKIQEDIATLRLVLNDKLKRENELKTLLGISFLTEMKQDLASGLTSVKGTSA